MGENHSAYRSKIAIDKVYKFYRLTTETEVDMSYIQNAQTDRNGQRLANGQTFRPAYAGAFVYGRRTSDAQRPPSSRRTPATVRRPMEEWQCVIQDAYPAYISWAQYLANQERLRENAQHYRALVRVTCDQVRQGESKAR